MTAFYVVIIILIICSAYFSGTEMAYTTVSEQRLQTRYEDKKTTARRLAIYLQARYARMLATILIGNNVVNLTASSIATVIVINLLGEAYSWVATLCMTLLILIFGEILPKMIGKRKPDGFCTLSAGPLYTLSVILYPVVYIVNKLTDIISGLWSNVRDSGNNDSITDGELESVIDIAKDEGVLDYDESFMVKRAITYKDIRAYEIITPRVDMEYIDLNDSVDEIKALVMNSTHSRLPVCDGDADSIIGVLHLNKLFYNIAEYGFDRSLARESLCELLNPPIFIPKTLPLPDAVELMRERQQQMIFVVDSYGGNMGLLTMEDALEVLVGDIWDESDDIAPDLIKLSDNEYDIGVQLHLRDLFDSLSLGHEYDDIADEYTIVGGWCVHELGLTPEVGESFDFNGLHFTISKLDGRKIVRVHLLIIPTNKK